MPQIITLYDLLDGWMHGQPLRAVGDIERRLLVALKETAIELGGNVRAMNTDPEKIARLLKENVKMAGLRFRLHGDEETIADRQSVREVYLARKRAAEKPDA